jgi:hypothetical protein
MVTAEQLVEEFKQRILSGAAPEHVLQHLIKRPVLDSFECRDAFEQQLAHQLASLPYPVAWHAFMAARQQFAWSEEYRRVQSLGYASFWISRILDQDTVWHRQTNSDQNRQLAHFKQIEQAKVINKSLAKTVASTIHPLLEHSPEWLQLRLGEQRIEQLKPLMPTHETASNGSSGLWSTLKKHPFWLLFIVFTLIRFWHNSTEDQPIPHTPTPLYQTAPEAYGRTSGTIGSNIAMQYPSTPIIATPQSANIIITPTLCVAVNSYDRLKHALNIQPHHQFSVLGQQLIEDCQMLTKRSFPRIQKAPIDCPFVEDLAQDFRVMMMPIPSTNSDVQAIFHQCHIEDS